MIRFVFLAAFVLLLVWAYRSLRRGPSVPPPADEPPKAVTGDEMVACQHCGVHLPRGEATVSGEAVYCSEQHRLAHEKQPPPQP